MRLMFIAAHMQPVLNGRLDKKRDKHVFSYRHDAQEALSLIMPVRNESYHYHALYPVFQMNLPEGALREALERMPLRPAFSRCLNFTFAAASPLPREASAY